MNPTANEEVKNEMLDIYKDFGSLNEVDWSKVRDMSFNEDKTHKRVAAEKIATSHCLECPDFLEHVCLPCSITANVQYATFHEEHLVRQKIEDLRNMMSDQNLELLPDYEQRINVLKDLGFIDENGNVELKGRVACEINSVNELILTELILDNTLGEFEPEEIVALLSAFVFEEKTDAEPQITPRLEEVCSPSGDC